MRMDGRNGGVEKCEPSDNRGGAVVGDGGT